VNTPKVFFVLVPGYSPVPLSVPLSAAPLLAPLSAPRSAAAPLAAAAAAAASAAVAAALAAASAAAVAAAAAAVAAAAAAVAASAALLAAELLTLVFVSSFDGSGAIGSKPQELQRFVKFAALHFGQSIVFPFPYSLYHAFGLSQSSTVSWSSE